MDLITPDDLIKSTLPSQLPFAKSIAVMVHRLLKLDKINRFYQEHHLYPPDAFIDSAIKQLGFQYQLAPEEIENLPKQGPFITISNHAYGGIDGLILLKALPEIRPDYKILMNYLLAMIQPIANYSLKVNPFEKRQIGRAHV